MDVPKKCSKLRTTIVVPANNFIYLDYTDWHPKQDRLQLKLTALGDAFYNSKPKQISAVTKIKVPQL